MLFVSIAFPVAENLDKVIRNTSPCSRSGAPFGNCDLKNRQARPALRRIALNLSVSKELDEGRPFLKRNRGPGRLPRHSRKEATG